MFEREMHGSEGLNMDHRTGHCGSGILTKGLLSRHTQVLPSTIWSCLGAVEASDMCVDCRAAAVSACLVSLTLTVRLQFTIAGDLNISTSLPETLGNPCFAFCLTSSCHALMDVTDLARLCSLQSKITQSQHVLCLSIKQDLCRPWL